MVNPNAKGAGFERQTCQRLSLWVSNMTREDVYWRSAMSGGRATLRTRRNRGPKLLAQAGDVTATHQLGHLLLEHFLLECKFYKDLKWSQAVHGVGGELPRVWHKPCKEADENARMPMVVVKQNHQPELVLLTRAGRRWLQDGERSANAFPVRATFPPYGMYVSFLRDLLAGIDFSVIRNKWEKESARA